jgi:hypothetical protein
MKYRFVFWIPYVKRVYRSFGLTPRLNVNLVPKNSRNKKHIASRLRFGRRCFCGAEKSHKPIYLSSERRIRSHLKKALPGVPSSRSSTEVLKTNRLPFKQPKERRRPLFRRIRQTLPTHQVRVTHARQVRRGHNKRDKAYCDQTLLNAISDYRRHLPPKVIRHAIWRFRARVNFFVPGGYNGCGEYECRTFYRDEHPFRYSRLKYAPALDKGNCFISLEQWDHFVQHEKDIVKRYNIRREFVNRGQLSFEEPGTALTLVSEGYERWLKNPRRLKVKPAVYLVSPTIGHDPEIPDDEFNADVCELDTPGPDKGILAHWVSYDNAREARRLEMIRQFELTGSFPEIRHYNCD